MGKIKLLLGASILLVSGQVGAALFNLDSGSLIDATSSSQVNASDGSGFLDSDIDIDYIGLPTGSFSSSGLKTTQSTAAGFNLASSVYYDFASGDQGFTSVANGSSFSDISNSDPGFFGSTQSVFIITLKIDLIEDALFLWDYDASGQAGSFGTSNGIDMRIKIREWADNTYSGTPVEVTSQFFGAGSADYESTLDPGFYDFVMQGRVLFNSPNISNRDGDSSWNYSASLAPVSPVPAPPALLLFGTGLLGLIGFSKRRKAT